MSDLTPARLAELRTHYERFDKHSPTALELIDEIERLRAALDSAAADIADRFESLCQWEADERHECTCHIAAHDAALIARGEA